MVLRMSAKEGHMSVGLLVFLLAFVLVLFICITTGALWSPNDDKSEQPASQPVAGISRESSQQGSTPQSTQVPRTLSATPQGLGRSPGQPAGAAHLAAQGQPAEGGAARGQPIQTNPSLTSFSSPAQPVGSAAQHLTIPTNPQRSSPGLGPVGGMLSGNLTLPAVESRFAVRVSDLEKAGPDSTLDIVAVSGLPLLQMKISGNNRLNICLAHQASNVRCSVIADFGGGPFMIHDAHNKPYGQFRHTSPPSQKTEVVIEGMPSLIVEGNSTNLQYSVTHLTGSKPVALARVNKEDFSGDYLEIRALPGADAVLVLSVILALAIFTKTTQ